MYDERECNIWGLLSNISLFLYWGSRSFPETFYRAPSLLFIQSFWRGMERDKDIFCNIYTGDVETRHQMWKVFTWGHGEIDKDPCDLHNYGGARWWWWGPWCPCWSPDAPWGCDGGPWRQEEREGRDEASPGCYLSQSQHSTPQSCTSQKHCKTLQKLNRGNSRAVQTIDLLRQSCKAIIASAASSFTSLHLDISSKMDN